MIVKNVENFGHIPSPGTLPKAMKTTKTKSLQPHGRASWRTFLSTVEQCPPNPWSDMIVEILEKQGHIPSPGTLPKAMKTTKTKSLQPYGRASWRTFLSTVEQCPPSPWSDMNVQNLEKQGHIPSPGTFPKAMKATKTRSVQPLGRASWRTFLSTVEDSFLTPWSDMIVQNLEKQG